MGTWPSYTSPLIEWRDSWNQALGSTGYVVTGNDVPIPNRISDDIIAYGFDRVVFFGGVNDASEDQATIATAVADALSQVSAVPWVLVLGCWAAAPTPGQSIIDTDDTIRSEALSAGRPFVSPVMGEVVDSAGSVIASLGPWVTSENASTMVGSDGVHPTDAGSRMIGERVAEAITLLS